MLSFISKNLLQINFSFKSYSCIKNHPNNFTIEYLINSCGFSNSAAIITSQKIHFETPKKPDSVINLLTTYGFTNSQISTLIIKIPTLLLSNPEKTLKPKIDFLKSIGIHEVGVFLSKDPYVLKLSLNKQINPAIEFLESILKTRKNIICSLKCSTRVFNRSTRNNLKINVGVLREIGVPESNIIYLLKRPRFFSQAPDLFNEDIHTLKELGFDPSKHCFVDAISKGFQKMNWEGKFEVYRRWGWSDDDILSAFKKYPSVLGKSEEKIDRVMDLVINKMGWDTSDILRWPVLLGLSLEKRMIPRFLVVRYLLSKGLMGNKRPCVSTLLGKAEKQFLDMFVNKHNDHVAELMKLYQGKKVSAATRLAVQSG